MGGKNWSGFDTLINPIPYPTRISKCVFDPYPIYIYIWYTIYYFNIPKYLTTRKGFLYISNLQMGVPFFQPPDHFFFQLRSLDKKWSPVDSYPIGSVCMVYMLTKLGYFLMVNVTINMAYIRIRHGYLKKTIRIRRFSHDSTSVWEIMGDQFGWIVPGFLRSGMTWSHVCTKRICISEVPAGSQP